MNASQFMDKQILELSGSHGTDDFLELASASEEQHRRHSDGGGGVKKEEILPSYDFQPIRTVGSSPPSSAHAVEASRPSWGSVDSKTASSNLKYAGILKPHEFTKASHEKERAAYDVATVAEIDRTVKKYADNLMHALDGVSSRLSQMESRTHHLESSVDELKVAIGNNNGSTDGKLRKLENILREVQTGIQVLRDKQEIAEAQLQLAKLAATKGDHQTSENSNIGQSESRQQSVPPQQSSQPPFQPSAVPPQPPSLSAPPAPNAPPPPQQNQPPVPFPGQLPQSQIPSLNSYYAPPAQSTDTSHQQYQMPSHQHQAPPPQPYQSAPQLPQYPQPPHPPQPVNPSQPQPPLPHHPEDSAPYITPPQTYPPSIRQASPLTQPPSGPPQQFYGPNPSMYEPPTSRPASGQLSFSAGYGPPMGAPSFSDPYPYSGSPSPYSSSVVKPSPFSSATPSSGNSYQRLPTAQLLPQAQVPGSSGGATGNRVPIDDVVDKVATMGFSRDQVRATVRKLTENGQSVDLNTVLDKLMNDGEIQPQKGWFGR